MSINCIEGLALSMIKGINTEVAVKIVEIFGDLHEFFSLNISEVRNLTGISESLREILSSRTNALEMAEKEMEFIVKHNIKVLNVLDTDAYPYRLAQCPDAPLNLFVLGDANLNHDKILAVVGTRKADRYGLTYTEKIVEQVKECAGDVTIVSGLAYGIDKAAHQAALKYDMPTVAVVAHGLGMIYPAAHRSLASNVLKSGGAIVTEYLHDVKPLRSHFLERNRIIAGMSDVTLVAQSPLSGGALNTAAHARAYNRDVLALPGRLSDTNSLGCNALIAKQLALLCPDGKGVVETAHWKMLKETKIKANEEPSLFDNYEGDVAIVYSYLKKQISSVSLDAIVCNTNLSAKKVMVALGEMQMDGVVERMPGARYALI